MGRIVGPSPSQTFNSLIQAAFVDVGVERSSVVVRRANVEKLADEIFIGGINSDPDPRRLVVDTR